MTNNRRSFLRSIGELGAAYALAPQATALRIPSLGPASTTRSPAPLPIRLDSNENPFGPSPAARAAIARSVDTAGRYPNSQPLISRLAAIEGVTADNILLTVGATEGLLICARAFTAAGKGLVTASPSYETIASAAERLGSPVVRVPLLADGRVDLSTMADKTQGAGLVFVCNPNNPSGVSVSSVDMSAFLHRVHDTSPNTVVLVGEAYHEYVDAPAYRSAVPDAVRAPGILVSRTFSKLYGLAGLRIGYLVGHPDTLRAVAAFRVGLGANSAALDAAVAALGDGPERSRVRDVARDGRKRTLGFFADHGRRTYSAEANYVFFETQHDIDIVRARCLAKGLLIGYPYPGARTWARITIGTPEEMTAAFAILDTVLSEL